MGEPAAFLDRDGTICAHVPYLDDPQDLQLLPTAAAAVRSLNEAGVPVIVVTNQSGIGRGYFSRRTLDRINARLVSDLADRGAHVDDLYYCPHRPDDGCDCRKPEPGMLRQAATDHDLELAASTVVGDRASDLTAGRRVGAQTVLFPSPETDEPANVTADHTVDSLREAARIVRATTRSAD